MRQKAIISVFVSRAANLCTSVNICFPHLNGVLKSRRFCDEREQMKGKNGDLFGCNMI
jgi:hypothetical protein